MFDHLRGACSLHSGVAGARWLAWDLRQPGLAPPPHAGDALAAGCTFFRWAPEGSAFAVGGPSDLAVLWLQRAESGPAAWSASGAALSHDLPTRVSSLSWVASQPHPMLAGAVDTKVCLWAVAPRERAAL